MRIILDYNPTNGMVTDAEGPSFYMIGLKSFELEKEKESKKECMIDGEQLIRIMKIAAHIKDATLIRNI